MDLKHFSLLSLVCLLIAGKSSGTTPAGKGLCSSSDYPDLCQQTIKGSTDPKIATQATIQSFIPKVLGAKDLAQKLGTGSTGFEKSNFETCTKVYEDAVSSLQTSLKSIEVKDEASLKNDLSAVISLIVTCDDTITNKPGDPKAPLSDPNKLLLQFGSNCLALADQMKF